jgi:formyltetrahydrofolate hydrolase
MTPAQDAPVRPGEAAHYVTEDLDKERVIELDVVRVTHADTGTHIVVFA